VEGLRDLGRKLIVREEGVEYVIVRAQDAPSFVAFGGADCGICGRDSIIEADVDLLQLVDLRYGWCRFVVAEPADAAGMAERAYAWRGTMRVATKYPRITQAYYDRIGQQVDLVQLHGNIELGPIVGMTDRIVDITATGTTLAENNLVIVDDVLECTARFFAGPAAYRCDARIRSLAKRLGDVTTQS
jgi:ATP phosphoribosyltransferase regulatory subunit